jgi:hypothetical protein
MRHGKPNRKLLKPNQKNLLRCNNCGFGFAEIMASSFLVIIMLIFSLDAWFLIQAAPMNDYACRDAARAAAQGGDPTTAQNLASAAIQSHAQQASCFVSAPYIDPNAFVYNDFGVSEGNPVQPPANTAASVSVTTRCTVKPIVPLSFMGSIIMGGNDTITFSQTYTFPIVKTKELYQ